MSELQPYQELKMQFLRPKKAKMMAIRLKIAFFVCFIE